jgi:hypothetical protein
MFIWSEFAWNWGRARMLKKIWSARDNSEKMSQKKDVHWTIPVLINLVSGGVAGCVAKTAVAPFDRVKILFQVLRFYLACVATTLSSFQG